MKKALLILVLVSAIVFIANKFFHFFPFQGFAQKITTSVTRQGKWYVQNQKPEGDFVYERYVRTGEPTDSTNNIVRQAGVTYGLAQIYSLNHNPEILKTLEKAFEYFKTITFKVSPTESAIKYNDKIASNATALLILGLSEYIEADEKFRTQENLEYLTSLSNYLVSTQLPTGEYINETTAKGPVVSDYNNGETMYALARSYKITKNPAYLASIKKFADFSVQSYGSQNFNNAYFSWGMAGFAHLYQITKDDSYWEFLKSYSDKYFESAGDDYDWYLLHKEGDPMPPGAAVFLEGVDHLAWIAKEKDNDLYQKLKTHIEKNLNFLLGYEIKGPFSRHKVASDKVAGAICANYSCDTTRIDFLQHFSSAVILYLRHVQ